MTSSYSPFDLVGKQDLWTLIVIIQIISDVFVFTKRFEAQKRVQIMAKVLADLLILQEIAMHLYSGQGTSHFLWELEFCIFTFSIYLTSLQIT